MLNRIIPEDYQIFSSFGAAIDLYTSKNAPAIVMKIEAGSGTVTVKMAGSGASARTLTVAAGDEIWGKFMSIDSVATVTKVRVGWA